MIRKILLVTACVAGLSAIGPVSSFAAESTPLTAEQQQVLDTQIAAVEALVVQYKDDPAGLELAVEALVTGAADPEVSGQAVLIVFNNSTNPNIKSILASNADLAAAGGKGLGAAIASIGLTNPTLATSMAAAVTASGKPDFVASVQSGTDTKTASLNQKTEENRKSETQQNTEKKDTTPENPASAS